MLNKLLLTLWSLSLLAAAPLEIPIQRLKYDFRFADADIQGQKFLLLIDTGSGYAISLNKRLTQDLELIKTGKTANFFMTSGEAFHSDEILIPEVHFGPITFTNILGREDGEWLDQNPLKIEGILGRPFLQNHYVLIDLVDNKLILSETQAEIEDLGYPLDQWTATPFSLTNVGIILDVQIQNLPAQLALDTGSSHTIVKNSFKTRNNLDQVDTLTACGLPFNDFVQRDLVEPAEVDGFLGINFLNNRKLFIDFQQKQIRLSP